MPHEARYQWWTKPESEQFSEYLLHCVFDCGMDWKEALALAINNFNFHMPDPIDKLLEQP